MNLLPLGIDIAKLKFNACLIRDDGKSRHKVFANTQVGFSQLAAWLIANKAPRVHACLESTGTYGEALATHLADAGHQVSVVNPAAIKAYAGCQLSRTKTDKVDAELIARFCLTQKPPVWTPLPATNTRITGAGAAPRFFDRDAHDGTKPPGGRCTHRCARAVAARSSALP